MAATALLKSVNGGGSLCPRGQLKTKWSSWMCIRAVNRMPAGGGKSAVSHTHAYMIIWAHTHTRSGISTKNTLKNGHAHTVIWIEMNQLASGRHQCDRKRWRERGVSDEEEYIKALSVQAAVWEENVTQAPSHSDTLKGAEVASGKSTLTQWVDNVATCDVRREQDTARWRSLILFTGTCGLRKSAGRLSSGAV